jgi:DNA-binding NtrC family response regulator
VGATHRVAIKARIVAATNRDLAQMVELGTFRKDLFYRVNVVNLRLPPMRDRREDIPLLAAHFLDRVSRERSTKFTLSDEALRAMMRHDWPGNVRELEHAVERACALSSGPVLQLAHSAAAAAIETELKSTVAGLLLNSQLALAGNQVPSTVAEKLRLVAELAGTLREKLNASRQVRDSPAA